MQVFWHVDRIQYESCYETLLFTIDTLWSKNTEVLPKVHQLREAYPDKSLEAEKGLEFFMQRLDPELSTAKMDPSFTMNIYQDLLTSINIHWHLLTPISIYWYLFTSINIYKHLLTSINMYLR